MYRFPGLKIKLPNIFKINRIFFEIFMKYVLYLMTLFTSFCYFFMG